MEVTDLYQMGTQIATRIKAAITGLPTCELHQGEFDLPELDRFFHKTPAVLVACMGVDDPRAEGGELVLPVRWGAFLLVSGATMDARNKKVLATITSLILSIWDKTFGMDNVGAAEDLRIENLYSSNAEREGVALYSIDWNQDLQLTPELQALVLDDFNKFLAEWKLEDVSVANDDVQLEQ